MNKIYKDYLFKKHYLVKENTPVGIELKDVFATLFTLANKFGIKIVQGVEYAHPDMIQEAADMLGEYVPEPFYRGFPESVRRLTPDQLLFDQLYHYWCTYGSGDFDGDADHSLFEETFEKTAFKEHTTPKLFTIVTEAEGCDIVIKEAKSLLSNSRPLSEGDYDFVKQAWTDFNNYILPEWIPCKKTAIQLLYDTKSMQFVNYIELPDVIKLAEYIQYTQYGSEKLNKLNLKNQDRKLITRVLDKLFDDSFEYRSFFEKRQTWKGLLHHIHYKARNANSSEIISDLRNPEVHNMSFMSMFERLMRYSSPVAAAEYLADRKGAGALIRNLDYILSRCNTDEEVKEVLACLK